MEGKLSSGRSSGSSRSKQQKREAWARFVMEEVHACLLSSEMRLLAEKKLLQMLVPEGNDESVLYDQDNYKATLRAVKFA